VGQGFPRVLLADDHPMVLQGLKLLLSQQFEVVGEVADGLALLEAAVALRPELIVADISMPGIDGIEATRRLRLLVPEARVLILSFHTEPSWVQAAFEAGAQGYVTKTSASLEIETALREALQGNFYVSPTVTHAVLGRPRQGRQAVRRIAAPRPAPSGELTPREVEIVHLVGKALGNKEIADALGVTVATVRTHLNKVYEKLGAESRLELALYAAQSDEAVM
jgi:DNA-binding NarL/FixJ family response regulator